MTKKKTVTCIFEYILGAQKSKLAACPLSETVGMYEILPSQKLISQNLTSQHIQDTDQ
jgi:hypothetical protein